VNNKSYNYLEKVLAALPPVIIMEHENAVLYANPAAKRFFPWISENEMPREDLIRANHLTFSKRGVTVNHSELPGIRALRGEKITDEELTIHRPGFPDSTVLITSESGPNLRGVILSFVDITRQRESEEHMMRAIRTRDEFISMASHELKTPLTSVRLSTELGRKFFEKGQLGPDRITKLFDSWLQQTERLTNLIEDMLDITTINLGRLKINPEQLNLGEVIKNLIGQFPVNYIFFEQLSTITEGFWDKRRIEQIVANLLTNAIKYGNHKPVYVTLDRTDGKAIIKVRDCGIGISKKDQTKIFERFERVPTKSTVGGLGLGLFIVNQIVNAKGGNIKVESEPDKGSTFTVILPIRTQK